MSQGILLSEKIVERKKCALSGQEFVITDKDIEFLDKVSPVLNGKKYSIPTPTLCPSERQRRRLTFRNERKLYKRKCDATGKEIVSYYHSDVPFPVYHRDYWLSDKYNPTDYGIGFDSTKSFFDQMRELIKKTPRVHIQQPAFIENSPYTNCITHARSCYLVFDSDFVEKCYYCNRIQHSKDCLECSFLGSSEACFECIQCEKSFGLKYSSYCVNCRNSWFCDACIDCQNCLFCCNLVNKQYCFMNKQLTKEEFTAKVAQLEKDTNIGKNREVFHDFLVKHPKKFIHGTNVENSTGDDLYNVKNVKSGFGMIESEDCAYCDLLIKAKNCMDISSFGENMAWMYESVSVGLNSQNCIFCQTSAHNCSNLAYCYVAFNCQNCFGSTCIKQNAHHVILNTSYSVQEYEELTGKIIDHMRSTGEWGEFFPHELAVFGYNESIAQEYFPMNEEEVKKRGWNWYDGENKNTYIGSYYQPLPIDQYDEKIVGYDIAKKNIDEVLEGILECEMTKKPFKIIKQELAFYIENHLSLPRFCPDERHQERMSLKNPRVLFDRKCDECGASIVTTYDPKRPEKILCEKCYHKLVY